MNEIRGNCRDSRVLKGVLILADDSSWTYNASIIRISSHAHDS